MSHHVGRKRSGTGCLRVLVPLSCAALLAGCGGDDDSGETGGEAAAASSTSSFPIPDIDSADLCLSPEERAGVVKFPSANGALLAGVHLGEGSSGVVLAHMATGSLCDWIDYGRSLAERGTPVFAFDLNGSGLSQASEGIGTTPRFDADVAAAVQAFEQREVTSIAVVGASAGATAAVVAAADAGTVVTRVAELSEMRSSGS